MTAEHETSVRDEPGTNGTVDRFRGVCACGWQQPISTTSKGAAGFSASAHKKKALGQPIFAPKAKATELVHATDRSDRVLCGIEGTVTMVTLPGRDADATCPDCLVMAAALEAIRPLTSSSAHTLPATLVQVPSDEYAIANYREYRGEYRGEGPAYNAYLTRDGKRVATVDYAGNGGDVSVAFLDVPKGTYDYADSPEKDAFKVWVERFEGKWDEEYDLPWSFVGVIATLIEEAAMAQELNRLRTTVAILDGSDSPKKQYHKLSCRGKKADPVGAADWCMKQGKPGARVWDGKAWVRASELASV